MASTSNYESISAGDYAHQHNGNVYNTNTNNYTIHQQRSDQSSGNREKSKALLKAAKEGQTRRVDLLIQLGAERDHADGEGWTALHHASLGGFEDLVDALITKHGLDVNAVCSHGTPLCLAALKARANIVDMLLKHRAGPNAAGGLLASPLHAACCSGNVSVINSLLGAGAAPDAAFTIAITVGRSGLINPQALFPTALETGFRINISECRPLHVAAAGKSPDAIAILKKRAVDFEAFATLHNVTSGSSIKVSALWFCTNAPCAEALLISGGNVNWQDEPTGRSPLMLAVRRSDDLDLPRVLIKHGALIDAQDSKGNTALHAAASQNRPSSAKLLLQSRANLKITNKLGQSPLEVAVAAKADKTILALAQTEPSIATMQDGGKPTGSVAKDGKQQADTTRFKRQPEEELIERATPGVKTKPRVLRFIADALREKGITTQQIDKHRIFIDRTLGRCKPGAITTSIVIRSVAKEIAKRDAAVAVTAAGSRAAQTVATVRDTQTKA